MEFKDLQLSDRNIFEQFLSLREHYLSAYHFGNIYIWKELFRIFYAILDGHLYIFFKDKIGCFMYLPPLGSTPDTSLLNRCFAIMDEFNVNKDIPRIENVEEKDAVFYRVHGYIHSVKPGDYLCARDDIISLKGNSYKSKRASYNYFIKHYDFEFRPFLGKDTDACLALYRRWAEERKGKFADLVYRGMLEDCFSSHKLAMENFTQLGLLGYVVKIKDEIAGYTFGFPLNAETFCVLFEICNLSYRGISQFIFSQLCRQLSDYRYINIMDDSGLENLRRVKLSYRPVCLAPNYIIKRIKNRDVSCANRRTVPEPIEEVSPKGLNFFRIRNGDTSPNSRRNVPRTGGGHFSEQPKKRP
jgi:hypothetical protein